MKWTLKMCPLLTHNYTHIPNFNKTPKKRWNYQGKLSVKIGRHTIYLKKNLSYFKYVCLFKQSKHLKNMHMTIRINPLVS